MKLNTDKKFGKDLATDSVFKNLIQFALPILVSNDLSTGNSIINMIWVGNLIGKDAVGAIVVSFTIFLGMIALCSGATLATSILISKEYGAKDDKNIQKIVNNSWAVAIVLILLVSISGLLSSKGILALLRTPTEMIPLWWTPLSRPFFSLG